LGSNPSERAANFNSFSSMSPPAVGVDVFERLDELQNELAEQTAVVPGGGVHVQADV
jgi:hypothetical protein